MGRYIDKDALVAEIDRMVETITNISRQDDWDRDLCVIYGAQLLVLRNIAKYLDSLEVKVKEVDVDKEIQNEIYNKFFDLDGIAIAGTSTYATVEDMAYIAKHFYELGLKTGNKGE